MAGELDRARIEAVVQAVADRLPGDWLLVGGALVALWLEPRRVTEDIDLVGLKGGPDERLALLGLAHDLGLPVEALNSAADFFVHRIDGWREEIEVFRVGAAGRIFRPTPTLFLLLKLGRLTESDLQDCLSVLDRARSDGLTFDSRRVAAAIDALPGAAEVPLAQRRLQLRQEVVG